MSVLDSIETPEDRAPIITICGDAGTGKTRLAATFPNPIFIRAEDGLQSIPAAQRPKAFPLLKSADELWPQLLALLNEEHDYKTLVVDSVSMLEHLFIKHVMDADGRARSINSALGGYGAGINAVVAMHNRLRKACGLLNERRGMAIVFISHADLETMRLPDTDDYSRYSLRMMNKSLPSYVDDVDMVGFVRLVAALRGDDGERKKVISNGDRELICHATAASVSKNRYDITEPLDCPMGVNPLADLPGMPVYEAPKPKKAPGKAKVPEKATEDEAEEETEEADASDFVEN